MSYGDQWGDGGYSGGVRGSGPGLRSVAKYASMLARSISQTSFDLRQSNSPAWHNWRIQGAESGYRLAASPIVRQSESVITALYRNRITIETDTIDIDGILV